MSHKKDPRDDGAVFQNPEDVFLRNRRASKPVEVLTPQDLIERLQLGIGAMLDVAVHAVADARASRMTLREALLMYVAAKYSAAVALGEPGDGPDSRNYTLSSNDYARIMGMVQAVWGLLQTRAADVIKEMAADVEVPQTMVGMLFPPANKPLYDYVYAPWKKGKAT